MFVPYSHITPSVSLYTTFRSPYLPVCLTSRRPLTIFFSLRPLSFPYFSLLFLSSLLSRAHISLIFLSFLRHLSGIPHHKPDTFQIGNYKVRQEKEAGGRQSQQSKKHWIRQVKYKKTGRDKQRTGSTRKVPGNTRQYKTPVRDAQRQAERQKMAAVRKLQKGSRIPPSSHHTPAPRILHPSSSAPAGQQDNRISCEFQEQAEIG